MPAKLEKSNVEEIFGLSTSQQGMLFHYLKDIDGNYFNVQLVLQIDGPLDTGLMKESLNAVNAGNEVLRSVFTWEKTNRPLQVVLKKSPVELVVKDFSDVGCEEAGELCEAYLEKDRAQRFDLRKKAIRFGIVQLSAHSFLMHITHHHILYDGWSTGILLKEIFSGYRALLRQGQAVPVVKPAYKETQKQAEHAAGDGKRYWADRLRGYEVIKLAKQEGGKAAADLKKVTLADPTLDLNAFSANYKVTKAAVVYAAYGILLQKNSFATDVVFGTVVSYRDGRYDQVMGNFINTIPLRVCDNGHLSLLDTVMKVHGELIAGSPHHRTSYFDIKQAAGLRASEDLFDSIVVIENYPLDKTITNEQGGYRVKLHSLFEHAGIPLLLTVFPDEGLRIDVTYDGNVVPEEMISALPGQLIRVIRAILDNPLQTLQTLALVGEEDREKLLRDFTDMEEVGPDDRSIIDLLNGQVERNPDAMAVIFQGEQLSYGELDRRTNRLARYLRELGVGEETLVAVCMERTPGMIIGIWAILKAGGAYVPLDPDYPVERMRYMLEDSGAGIVLTDRGSRPRVEIAADGKAGAACRVVVAEEEQEKIEACSPFGLETGPGSGSLAYVIYTSGSTGVPKGVMVEHGNVVGFARNLEGRWGMTGGMRIGALTTYTFDISVLELICSLCCGLTVVLLDGKDPSGMLRQFRSGKLDALQVTPSRLTQIGELGGGAGLLSGLKVLLVGGEAMPEKMYAELKRGDGGMRVYNVYGPTEATIWSSSLSLRESGRLSVGKALAGERLYILDREGQVAPMGAAGELWIGGSGVARGYLNREALTAERFVPSPFRSGERLYGTGDLARWLPDGNIVLLGRRDGQVKIRGHRIEPGEIESRLLDHAEIKDAVVVSRERGGDNYLVGYYVAASEIPAAALKEYLSGYLPEYMLPACYVRLDRVPLNANGKTDRKALPEPLLFRKEEYAAPSDETQAVLAEIWSEVLELEKGSVSIDASFFHLGGHSLKVNRVVNRIFQLLEVEVTVGELFEHPHIRALSGLIREKKKAKFSGIARVEEQAYYTLSSAQRRLYYLCVLDKASFAYHMPLVLRLEGELDRERLTGALVGLVERHESLRTSFERIDASGEEAEDREGEVVQKIWKEVKLEIEEARVGMEGVSVGMEGVSVGIEGGGAAEGNGGIAEEEISSIIRRFIRPFDLGHAPLLRVGLVALPDRSHLLLVDLHHIVADGVSQGILIREFMALYNQESLPDLRLRYRDYAHWQQSGEERERMAGSREFWKRELSGELSVLNPATDRARPVVKRYVGDRLTFSLDREEVAGLRETGAAAGATLFMTLLAVFKVLLSRLSGQEEITVGTAVAGRAHVGVEGIVGMFVNTLALRDRVSGDQRFRDFLAALKDHTISCFNHQLYPYEELVRELRLSRDVSRNPLFDVVFSYENFEHRELVIPGIKAEVLPNGRCIAKFDLTLTVVEPGEGEMPLEFEYSTDLFDRDTIVRYMGYFRQIVREVIRDADQPISTMEILPEAERRRVLYDFNDTAVDYGIGQRAIGLFGEQVERNPDHAAVMYGHQKISYLELNRRADRIAWMLVEKGVPVQGKVVVMMKPGVGLIAVLLGVSKAGGVYVPLSDGTPMERVHHIVSDCGASLVISQAEVTAGEVPEWMAGMCLLAEAGEDGGEYPSFSRDLSPADRELLYIIYTSGSTGMPKGVAIRDAGVVNTALFYRELFGIGPGARVSQAASIGFDASALEIWPCLISGGCLCIAPSEARQDPAAMYEWLHEEKVEVTFQVPVLAEQLLRQAWDRPGSRVRGMGIGGDRLNYFPGGRLPFRVYNLYGPTEDAIVSTCKEITGDEKQEYYNIGRPISNKQVYILGGGNRLQPIGVPGELCVSGAGVGKGYVNNVALTAEKFIENPYRPGQRLYRTGDLARWLPDGDIALLGRLDRQVKIRGFRIELGEIEYTLQSCPGVDQAAVVVRTDAAGRKQLAGYVVPFGAFDREGIVTHLKRKLPEYMVPAVFVELKKLPLTASGKVDRKALPDPDTLPAREYTAPRNEPEQTLAGIWQRLLGIERVGIYDDFFESGGDSIMAIQLVSRVRRAGYQLNPKDIFHYPTIAQLALQMENSQPAVTAEGGELRGEAGLLPIQQWFFEWGDGPALNHFSQSLLLCIDKRIDEGLLSGLAAWLQAQHDALRFAYRKEGNSRVQYYSDRYATLATEDLSGIASASLPETITALCDRFQESLHIGKGDLFRMVWIKTPSGEAHHRLLLIVHHLAIDGISWRILLDDMEAYVAALMQGSSAPARMKSGSYRGWYEQLVRYSRESRLSRQGAYWQQAAKAIGGLPADRDYRQEVLMRESGEYIGRLPAGLTQKLLQEVSRAYRTEINDILLAALARTLCRWSGRELVVIGLEGHGREPIYPAVDISHTVGWFTSLYPVVLHTEGSAPDSDCIKSIKEQLRQVPDKGLGHGVLKYICGVAALREDNYELTFNYLGQTDSPLYQSGWFKLAPESPGNPVSGSLIRRDRIAVNSLVQGGCLSLHWSYSQKHYEAATIEQLAIDYQQDLEALIRHCVSQAKQGMVCTPADYGLSGVLSYRELDRFLETGCGDGASRRSGMSAIYRLNAAQEGMLFHSLYDDGGASYVEQLTCDVEDPDVDALRQSWAKLLEKHSILRTGFHHKDLRVPMQCVHSKAVLPFEILDFRDMEAEERQAAIEEFLEADYSRGIDLEAPPLMRISLLQTGRHTYRMIWTFHHILLDGWSLSILLGELLQGYEQLKKGAEAASGHEDLYEDYIRYLDSKERVEEEGWWRKYMEGLETATLLPFIKNGPDRNKGRGEYKEDVLVLDDAVAARVKAYARSNGLTLNTVMQGVWAFLLQAYTGQPSVTFGVVVSGRPDELPDIERRVGLYINTLPLHARVDKSRKIAEWLREIQQGQVGARAFEHTALTRIQEWTGITGDLFDSLIGYENYPFEEALLSREGVLKMEGIRHRTRTNYPLTISIVASGKITIRFSYNTTLVAEKYCRQLEGHFKQVLLQLTDEDKVLLKDVSLLTERERAVLLQDFAGTSTGAAPGHTVLDLFGEWVRRTPEAVAVTAGRESATYRQLEERSNRLAYGLRGVGVGEEMPVPLCVGRGIELIIGMLGIMKAGGAYVPLDPGYPEERTGWMLKDTGAAVVVAGRAVPLKVPDGVIRINIEDASGDEVKELEEWHRPRAEQLAYVIYTSGSTGRPKGVMIEHRSVVNLVEWHIKEYAVNEGNRATCMASVGFDACGWEIWPYLCAGARLYMVDDVQRMEAEEIVSLYERYGITHSFVATVLAAAVVSASRGRAGSLRYLLTGGDRLGAIEMDNIGYELVNNYGPTEHTVVATFYRMSGGVEKGETPSIGKPVTHSRVYVLDGEMSPVPAGVPGELYISGPGLARGYWGREDMTAEKFVTNPFVTTVPAGGEVDRQAEADRRPGGAGFERLYRTGDLVSWREDGNLSYLGRIDDQVKIRGYRIELGEIEGRLLSVERVKEATVVVQERQGDKFLVGYYVSEEEIPASELRAYLSKHLPEYMLPTYYVHLERLPLNANGKIDRKRLPEPEIPRETAYAGPSNEMEAMLAEIWSGLLNLDKDVIGVHKNFFELGGNSLKIVQLKSLIDTKINRSIPVLELFRNPSISSLADFIETSGTYTGRSHSSLDAEVSEMEDLINHLD